MTEQEWLTGEDPRLMLALIPERENKRKLRLFACACCRQVWNVFVTRFTVRVVEAVEAAADGEVSEAVLSQTYASRAADVASSAAMVAAGGSNYPAQVALAAYAACNGQIML